MIDWLLLATVMAVIAILIYGAGIPSLGRTVRNTFVILSIVLRLFTLHGIKIWLYYWRLVGAIKGGDGILLLGWSTTYFVTVVDCRRR
jgi:hypothetical protein